MSSTSDDPPAPPRRRQLGAAVLAGALLAGTRAHAQTDPEAEHLAHMPPRPDRGPKLKIAMLVYPRMIMIDLAVPQTVFNILGSDIHLVGKTLQPVSTDIGLTVPPTCTFADCPSDLDVLFVPGGLM
ncbi:MAG: DJ-1/PfpI family protein, partial [Alphaproteobacteria bacterium]